MSLCLCGLTSPSHLLFAENWPQWRGPGQNGASRESGLPITWSESSRVVWKCPLEPWGTSTPAIWGDAIFVTTHVDDQRLVLVKVDKKTGRIEWTRQVGEGAANRAAGSLKARSERGRQHFNPTHNLATPSPVTDGQLVVVHFGNGDLAAYDFAGKRLWRRNLQEDFGPFTIWWGHANSPMLFQDLVISVCMQDTCADLDEFKDKPFPSYLVAHDKRTGELKWKTMRPTPARAEAADSYTTPLFWKHGDQTEMIVMGGLVLDGYDPATGKRLWYLPGLTGNRVITGPVVAGDVVYFTQGMRQPVLAVKLGGRASLPKSDILWEHRRATPDSPTPVVWGDLLFLVNESGIAQCLDTKTGKVHWEQRLKGDYRASPLAAEGRIYFLNMKGLATVVSASANFEKLAENQLDDQTIASPVVSDGRIFIRGNKTLYCLGKSP
jgi:outer membrane protein assembly factor BamB